MKANEEQYFTININKVMDQQSYQEKETIRGHMERAKFHYIEPIKISESTLAGKENKYKERKIVKKKTVFLERTEKQACKSQLSLKRVKIGRKEEIFRNYDLVDILKQHPRFKITKMMFIKQGSLHKVKFVSRQGQSIDPLNEADCYQKMENKEKVLPLLEVYSTNSENIFVYNLYEHDLEEFVRTLPQPLSQATLKDIARKACEVIETVHAQGLVHRDIKGQSFAMETVGKNFRLLLKDLAVACEPPEGRLLEKFIGSPNYVAPEVLEHRYGRECDVWSCGVMLFKLVAGAYPFRSCEKYENAYESACLGPLKMQGPPGSESPPNAEISSGGCY